MSNSLHFELWLAWTTLRNDLKCLIAFCQRVLCIEIGFLVIFASHRHSTLTFKQAKPKEELFEVSRQFPVWIVWTDIRLHYLCQPFSESEHLKGQLWPCVSEVSVTFLLIPALPPPRSVVTTREWRKVCVKFLLIPARPHLKGQLRLVFHCSGWVFMVFIVPGCFSWFQAGFHGSRLVSSWFSMVPASFFMVPGWFSWFFMVPGWFFMVPVWRLWFYMIPGRFS